jgi:hypothetical protein
MGEPLEPQTAEKVEKKKVLLQKLTLLRETTQTIKNTASKEFELVNATHEAHKLLFGDDPEVQKNIDAASEALQSMESQIMRLDEAIKKLEQIKL